MKKYIVHAVWLVVAIIALVGGMYYGKATALQASGSGRFGAFAGSGRGGSFASRTGSGSGGSFVAGQIVSEGADSLTISLPNGNSEVVFYSSSTAITMPAPASPSDLTTGTGVVISGTSNSDGSFTAQSIQVRS